MALQRANDLAELSVDIELFPMPKPVDPDEESKDDGGHGVPMFDVRKFYANIISYDEDQQFTELLGIEGAQSRIFELMKRIRQKEFKKRTLGKCMFNVSPGAKIGLSFFSTIIPAKKPNIQKVNAVNNKQLRSTQRFICNETGQTLYRQEIGTYYPVGSEKVEITQEEMRAIKKFDRVGMTLMGFKPRSYLKCYHNVKHSMFVFPDEKKVIGSSQVSDALIKEMIRKDKIAIVRVQVRESTSVRFCALLP